MKFIKSATALAAVLAISTAAHAEFASQLGILDLNANGGINPGTGQAWQAGDKYHLIYVTTALTIAASTIIPEPSTAILLGLASLALLRRRR